MLPYKYPRHHLPVATPKWQLGLWSPIGLLFEVIQTLNEIRIRLLASYAIFGKFLNLYELQFLHHHHHQKLTGLSLPCTIELNPHHHLMK